MNGLTGRQILRAVFSLPIENIGFASFLRHGFVASSTMFYCPVQQGPMRKVPGLEGLPQTIPRQTLMLQIFKTSSQSPKNGLGGLNACAQKQHV
ncbi:hypothetical protein [Acinetobacter baumannii]|uniref:hypothetical protein n=1 Tax=Acinetobacter baumannii TaxID=470 RepID=UPI0018E17B4F|nr:hypothetical protein [Acinetobacter baumannii]MBI1430193.1 hypothetical protein [Acinetobacter baumannii]